MSSGSVVCVVGSGVAGLSSALAAVERGADVVLVTPGSLQSPDGPDALAGGNTALAQGGISAAIGSEDSATDHQSDTIAAGYGLVDDAAAHRLTEDGVHAVRRLLAGGMPVDRQPNGAPTLGLEAAHSHSRIVHAGGDRTGAVLHAYLVSRVLEYVAEGKIELREHSHVTSLTTRDGVVVGVMLGLEVVSADSVVLATGGYAALYPRTSNHAGARGEGVVLAAQAGAVLADLEFVQFHPTTLLAKGSGGYGFLVSEAVRGAGAVLRDGSGARFMVNAHPAAELAPRDAVSREIERVISERGEAHVWLDATSIEQQGGPGSLAARFPSITAAVHAQGYDWAAEPVPVAPAAHYSMGGVATDLDGRTSVPGLFAAGEVASTGVHGANRLASNSLLEGLVFGARAGRAAADAQHDGAIGESLARLVADADEVQLTRTAVGPASLTSPTSGREVGAALAAGLSIVRDASGIAAARACCEAASGTAAQLGVLLAASAAARTESRGAHQRRDYPATDPAQMRRVAIRVGQSQLDSEPDSEVPNARTHEIAAL